MLLSDDPRVIPKHRVRREYHYLWTWECGFCCSWDAHWKYWRDAFAELEKHHNLCCRKAWESRTNL